MSDLDAKKTVTILQQHRRTTSMGLEAAKGTKVTIKNGDLKHGHTTLKPAVTRKKSAS